MDTTFIAVSIVVALAVLMGVGAIWASKKRHKISPQEKARLIEQWGKIVSEATHNPKNAILEADKLLDHVLKLKGFEGSLGEKLKKAQHCFRDLDRVWSAHKWRNRIAHELNITITPQEAKAVLNHFRQALKDLGL